MHKPTARRLIWWCGLAACVVALVFAARGPLFRTPPLTLSGQTMGTGYTIKMVGAPPSVDVAALNSQVRQTLDRIEARMSTYRADSELSRLNIHCGGEWFDVSLETARVIQSATEIGRLTGGAFDVTVGPLVNLWNFGPGGNLPDRIPDDEQIARAKSRVGFDAVEVRLSPPAVRKRREDLYIDLSGIAKGYAVDQIAERLDQSGVEDYLVEIGGELRATGHNHRGRPWQVAVESPVAEERSIQRVVAIEGLAMATSGDYRNYFEKDGVRYSHIIDPRSGRPVAHRLASVTVLSVSCTRADALATALLVLGPEAGYDLALKEGIAALFIVRSDAGFVEKATPSFTEVLQ